MEDQQPGSGDLNAAAGAAGGDESADAATRGATVPAVSVENAGETATAPGDGPEHDISARTRRPAGTRLAVAFAVAASVFVGSAAFAGAAVQPYLGDRATAATKLRVARTAANAITTLWTYTPENMNTLADRAAGYLGGDFEAQYRKFVDSIVAPNKQAQVTNSTEVTGAAVESLDGSNAVVIVYTNTSSTSPLTKNVPALKYLSYRLFLKRASGRWLVTRMTTITSLNLTPHV